MAAKHSTPVQFGSWGKVSFPGFQKNNTKQQVAQGAGWDQGDNGFGAVVDQYLADQAAQQQNQPDPNGDLISYLQGLGGDGGGGGGGGGSDATGPSPEQQADALDQYNYLYDAQKNADKSFYRSTLSAEAQQKLADQEAYRQGFNYQGTSQLAADVAKRQNLSFQQQIDAIHQAIGTSQRNAGIQTEGVLESAAARGARTAPGTETSIGNIGSALGDSISNYMRSLQSVDWNKQNYNQTYDLNRQQAEWNQQNYMDRYNYNKQQNEWNQQNAQEAYDLNKTGTSNQQASLERNYQLGPVGWDRAVREKLFTDQLGSDAWDAALRANGY